MIVMTRKRNETIVIGDDIFVSVVEVRDDKVRLGIDHPRDVSVHRREVFEALRSHAGGSPPEPATGPAAPQPTTIALADRHVALLDRLRSTIGGRGGTAPSREEALGAILDAFESAQVSVSEAALLADLEPKPEEGRRGEG